MTRIKNNDKYQALRSHVPKTKRGVISDHTIQFTCVNSKECGIPLRRIVYHDSDSGKEYVFLTNHFRPAARNIADIYKERWQIELFFKWIKQNLKIKSFLGTSHNAVFTQILVAMCIYLILAFMKFMAKLGLSFQKILRLLKISLFERRDLKERLKHLSRPLVINKNLNQLPLI